MKHGITRRDASFGAWRGLLALDGELDLAPLIELLEAEAGGLHPLVKRELAALLRGTHRTHRLELKRRRGAPRRSRAAQARQDREILASPDPAAHFKNHARPQDEVRRVRHRANWLMRRVNKARAKN